LNFTRESGTFQEVRILRRRYATYIPGPEIRYNENLVPIDEQLCALLAQRQQTGGDTPGYPGDERIKAWAERFHLDSFQLELLFRDLGWFRISRRSRSSPLPTST
jgi:hypothetical protein